MTPNLFCRSAIITLLSICSTAFLSAAQNINLRFDSYDTDNGLSQENVTTIFEDDLGFIWIGTEDGLNLYNGYSFQTFRPKTNDSNSISSNRIDDIAKDKNGNIWIATSNGLSMYDRDMNHFVRYNHDPKNAASIPSKTITELFLDSKGSFWIGTDAGLSLFLPESQGFKTYKYDRSNSKSILNNTISSITEDQSGNLWIGMNGGISKMNPDESFTNIAFDPLNETTSLSSSQISTIHCDSKNRLWIGSLDKGLTRYNLNNGTFQYFTQSADDQSSVSNNYITKISENNNGELWIATDVGLNRYNENDAFSNFYSEIYNDAGLTSDIIIDIFFDREDRMWVGTRLGGVCVYDKDKYGFKHFSNNPLDPSSLSSNKTSGFLEDAFGNVYVATDGAGINYFDTQTQRFRTYLTHDPNNKNSLSSNKVLAMEADSKGGLWIGMWGGGLDYYHPGTGIIKHYKNDPSDSRSLSGNNIFEIFKDNQNNIWIGTWSKGLCKYNPDTDDFTNYMNDPNDPTSIGSGSISQILEDQNNNLWIPTATQGISVLNPKTNQFTVYRAGTADGDLSHDLVISILLDTKNRIWVGTLGGGLNMLDLETNKFISYTTEDGLPNDVVTGILEDNDGNIWISSNYGLSKFNPNEGTFRNYDKRDGLQGNQFMPRNSLKLSNGEMLFGGNNGFNLFDPKDLTENLVEPLVYITDIRLFNKPINIGEDEILKKNIIATSEIKLNYTQNFLSFEYLGINFRDPDKNQYQYIMEGLQDEWIQAEGERKVSFMNIDPGTYYFKVKASNNDGVWNEKSTALKIIITPPFWVTWWFRGALILIFCSIAFWIYKWRTSRLKQNRHELEQKIHEATAQVNGQNDELKGQSQNLKIAIEETNFVVTEAVESGNFSARIDTESKSGEWKALGNSINQLFETVIVPFNEINRIVTHLAEGDLTERFESDAKGDIRLMSINLNKAMDNLSDLLSGIIKRIEVIGDSSEDMLITSHEMNTSTGEIASSIAEMSKGAQDQVMKVDESSNLIEEILKSSQEMGQQAESINQTAKTGVEKSEDGMQMINKLDEGMKEILTSSGETNEAISELTNRSNEISGVIRIIKDIASQTNLLALNAAIEAAQAGDAGRGFAVVAEEIRKLAEDSKKSAGEIEDLINAVQTYTGTTADRIGKMSQSIKEGEEATQYSLRAFKDIAMYYAETLEKSEQILAATKTQKDDVGNIVSIINGVVVIAEETAAGTEEIASSSSELSAGMTNFTERSQGVSEIVNELRQKVAQFKLAENLSQAEFEEGEKEINKTTSKTQTKTSNTQESSVDASM